MPRCRVTPTCPNDAPGGSPAVCRDHAEAAGVDRMAELQDAQVELVRPARGVKAAHERYARAWADVREAVA